MSKTALQTALDLLSRRDHSADELLRKLALRGFSADSAHEALAFVQDKKILDNNRFIENFIQYRRQKGFGPLKIHAELIQRGITEEQIEHYLNITDNVWLDKIQELWQKRFKNQLPKDYKTRVKQMRFLFQRGFTAAQIDNIFKVAHNDEREIIC